MWKLINASLICLLLMSSASAQTGRIDYPYLGIQFTVPDGWQGAQQDDVFLMTSQSQPGVLAIFLNPATSRDQLKQVADQGIYDESTQLSRSSDFVRIGDAGLGAEFSGFMEFQSAKGFLVGVINPFGHSLTIAAVTSSDSYSSLQRELATQLTESVAFALPKESEKTKEWRDWLRGKRLTHMYSNYSSGSNYYDASGQTYGSYTSVSSTTRIELCSDQSFSFQASSQSSFDSVGGFGSGSSSDGGSGRWRIDTLGDGESLLTLTFNNGDTSEYELHHTEGKTYLGERRYLVDDASYCQ